jgi:hypothetical protein
MAHVHDPVKFSERVTDRDAILAAAQAAVTRLNAIIANIDGYNTAQLKTALQDVAQYERSLIRIVARQV